MENLVALTLIVVLTFGYHSMEWASENPTAFTVIAVAAVIVAGAVSIADRMCSLIMSIVPSADADDNGEEDEK